MDKSIKYMLIAGLGFSLMNIFVKLVNHLPTMEVVLFRAVLSFIFTWVMLRKINIPVLGKNKRLLFYRGVFGCLGLIGSFYTLQNIPLASAVTLNYLSPIFTAILGVFTVKQKLFKIQYVFFALGLFGVLLIKGFDPRISLVDVSIGLGAALAAGLAYNVIALLKTSEHPLVIMLYFPLVTIPFTLLFAVKNWVMPVGIDWIYLLLIGILTQLAQYYMTKSYQTANLAKVSILNYLGVVYAIIAGFFIFGETYSVFSYLGIALIIGSVILNIYFPKKRRE